MLSVKGLEKYYRSKKGEDFHALKGLNIEFPTNGFVFIIGKSGSGKSTLLNVLGGLDRYDSGEIFIKGKSSKTFKSKDWDSYRNTYLGFVFQDFNIIDSYTIGANIALALQLQGVKASEAKARTIEILKSVEAGELIDRKPNELSGGQKQRIAIARALVKNPEIIIADEPTGNLDSETSAVIMTILKRLAKERLVIMVTHDLDYANDYGDRIIEMRDGAIVKDTTQSAKSKEAVKLDYTVKGSFHLIKSKLPLHNSFSMALSSIWTKKFKLLFAVILFIASIGLFGFSRTVTRFDFPMAASLSYNESGTEQVIISKQQEITQPGGDVEMVNSLFLKAEIDALKRGSNLSFGYTYEFTQPLAIGTSTELEVRAQKLRGVLEIESLDSMNLNLVVGRFPRTPDEVMITDYVADQLITSTYQTYLESNPTLKLPFKTVVVVGIVQTDYKDYEYLNGLNDTQLLGEQGNVLAFANSDAILYSRIVVGTGFYEAYEANVDLLLNYYMMNIYIVSRDSDTDFPYEPISETFADPNHPIMDSEYVAFFDGHTSIPENGIVVDVFSYIRALVSLGRVANDTGFSYMYEDQSMDAKISRLKTAGFGAIEIATTLNDQVNNGWEDEEDSVIVGLVDFQSYKQNVMLPVVGKEALDAASIDYIDQDTFERYTAREYYDYLEALAQIHIPSAGSLEDFLAPGGTQAYEYFNAIIDGLFAENVEFISDGFAYGYSIYLRDLMDVAALSDLTYTQYTASNHANPFDYIGVLRDRLDEADVDYLDDSEFMDTYLRYGNMYTNYLSQIIRDNSVDLNSVYTNVYGLSILSTNAFNRINPFTSNKVHGLVVQLNGNVDDAYVFFTDAQTLGTSHITPSGELLQIFAEFTTDAEAIFGYVSLGVAAFAALLLFLNISASILAKKKEIGTLRAMGARGKDVASIFVNEALLLGAFSVFLAIVGIIVATLQLNGFLSEQLGQTLAIFNISPIIMGEMILLTMVIVLIASFLPVKRVSSMKPIDAIKNK